MRHHAPHLHAVFEGYYSKFTLPSGASLIVIVCSVPKAAKNRHQLSFTYVPADSQNVIQHELWVDDIQRIPYASNNAFEIRVPGVGVMRCPDASTTEYTFRHQQCVLQAKTSGPQAWSGFASTPEGLLVYLPLPLHWHVHSLGSIAEYELDFPGTASLPVSDRKGEATVHEEKNWAHSFPSAHMWVQAWDATSAHHGVCLAGGKVLGMEAYLVGYRNSRCGLNLTFRPPFALSAMKLSPFMRLHRDWTDRFFELEIYGWNYRIAITAQAPKGTFFSLSAPFHDGHRENYLAQSLAAQATVKVWRRRGWLSWLGIGRWERVCEERFEKAALEFGGTYYPLAGNDARKNA
ncbi:hypothetical protein EV356DRAFT_456266 [Viridothelium virens]|uniref:Uncharacterized protein n=1 Tax=Viridothelium virens TaxID=1048519 RepID=A0A6A6GU20_VIRVR|nr:hypothetical protein EV356DRAFT_456266 [Viridothelium virens]